MGETCSLNKTPKFLINSSSYQYYILSVLPLKRNQYKCTRWFLSLEPHSFSVNSLPDAEESAVQYNCRFGAKPQETAHKKLILIISPWSFLIEISDSIIQLYMASRRLWRRESFIDLQYHGYGRQYQIRCVPIFKDNFQLLYRPWITGN